MSLFVDHNTPVLCARESQERMDTARRQRDEWVRAAYEDGWDVSDLASQLGLRAVDVRAIVR